MDTIYSTFIILVQSLGIIAGIHAILNGRTSQGTVAWVIFLIFLPYIALIPYLIFGQRTFLGYISARRAGDFEINHIAKRVYKELSPFQAQNSFWRPLEKITGQFATKRNSASLLIDGEATFKFILNALENAKKYVLLQFYIVRNDQIGKKMSRQLISLANRGVAVYFIYDEIGSNHLEHSYINNLNQNGIQIVPFNANRRNKYQLNFRNHRKVVIIDGILGLLGGHNLGDEYLGWNSKIGFWRDTHLAIQGPAVLSLQLSFLEDWYWATQRIPNFYWKSTPTNETLECLIVPSGPNDLLESCGLSFLHMINTAQERLWIVSPYFVPNTNLMLALELTALRGVDVRILLPKKSDNLIVDLASWTFIQDLKNSGVRFFQYTPGMLHQKVFLIDQKFCAVGTANLDYRSLRINFEVMAVCSSPKLIKEVDIMLNHDLNHSSEIQPVHLIKSKLFWLFARIARLLSPIL